MSLNNTPSATRFRLYPALAAFVFLECLVGGQAHLAYQDQFLTVTQMIQRGTTQGQPFVWHFGMWSDLAAVSPLGAYLVGRYSRKWSTRSISASLAIGIVTSAFFHWLYTLTAVPSYRVHNHALTSAGYVHMIYMAMAISIFGQFLLFTSNVERSVLCAVSLFLIAHVLIGTQMLLGLFSRVTQLAWYPDQPLKSFSGWLTVSTVVIVLGWRYFKHEAFWEPIAKNPAG
jgi:hypothetical protein